MNISPYFILVSDITCNTPGRFDQNRLRQAARLIITGGGVINPLVVRQISFDRYELVDGIFEYYAALEAKKLDPMRAESINAYVIQPGQEPIIIEQVSMFRRGNNLELAGTTTDVSPDLMRQLEARSTAQDVRFESMLKKSMDAMEMHMEQSLGMLTSKLAAIVSNARSEIFRTTSIFPAIGTTTQEALQEEEIRFIRFLNHANKKDLQALESRVQHKAFDLLLSQRNRRPFDSEDDCLSRVRGKGFADGSYRRVLSAWRAKVDVIDGGRHRKQLESVPSLTQKIPEPVVTQSDLEPLSSVQPSTDDAAKKRNDARNSFAAAATARRIARFERTNVAASGTTNAALNVASAPKGIDKLNSMDVRELTTMLTRMRIGKIFIDSIIKQRPFASFEEMSIPGLGSARKKTIKAAFA